MAGLTTIRKNAPLWLLAELTYRCPLACLYCSNPLDLDRIGPELSTRQWIDTLSQARELGSVQLGISGGEPLARPDLEEIVSHASAIGFYVNLITSGIGLTANRLRRLKAAGLDHIQLSFQDSDAAANNSMGGKNTYDRKIRVAGMIKNSGYPMVMNVVLHRHNIDRTADIIALARRLDADYLEMANVQFDGWAFLNRDYLMPTKEQVLRSEAIVKEARLDEENLKIIYVVPDYYEGRPKACSGGWGSYLMAVTPDGSVLPCHGARKLPLEFPNVKTVSLEQIWRHDASFQRFRSDHWLPELCRSCPEKEKDFGGCRCQAFLLTGDMEAVDPTCSMSPNHNLVAAAAKKRAIGDPMRRPS